MSNTHYIVIEIKRNIKVATFTCYLRAKAYVGHLERTRGIIGAWTVC